MSDPNAGGTSETASQKSTKGEEGAGLMSCQHLVSFSGEVSSGVSALRWFIAHRKLPTAPRDAAGSRGGGKAAALCTHELQIRRAALQSVRQSGLGHPRGPASPLVSFNLIEATQIQLCGSWICCMIETF